MRHSLRGAALLLLAVFVLPVFAADEAKDAKKDDPKKDVKKDDVKDPKKDDVKKDDVKDPKKDDPKKDDPKKDDPKKDDVKNDPPKEKKEVKKDNGMVKVAQYTGTIVNFDETKRSMRLRIDVPKLNVSAAQNLAQAQVELQQAYIPKPGQKPQDLVNAINNAQKKIADNTRNLYTTTPVEQEWSMTEDAVIRVAEPPPQFDEKGKPKKLTAKEKAELKGDPKLPGYKGETSDVRSNQVVQVVLMRHKSTKAPKIDPKAKDVDPALLADLKPQISMVVVLGEKRQ